MFYGKCSYCFIVESKYIANEYSNIMHILDKNKLSRYHDAHSCIFKVFNRN